MKYILQIIGTLSARYPEMELHLTETDVIIPMCKMVGLECKDPDEIVSNLSMLPSRGEPAGTYHLTHISTAFHRECNGCPRRSKES